MKETYFGLKGEVMRGEAERISHDGMVAVVEVSLKALIINALIKTITKSEK